MQITDSDLLILLFFIGVFIIIISTRSGLYLICNLVKEISEKRNNQKTLELENKKIELFMQMDPKMAESEIDELVKKYLNDYIIKNFLISNIDYIKKNEIDKMVKELDRNIVREISELYIFYIKILTNITDEEDLIKYIDKKVKEHVLEFVTEFNRPKEK